MVYLHVRQIRKIHHDFMLTLRSELLEAIQIRRNRKIHRYFMGNIRKELLNEYHLRRDFMMKQFLSDHLIGFNWGDIAHSVSILTAYLDKIVENGVSFNEMTKLLRYFMKNLVWDFMKRTKEVRLAIVNPFGCTCSKTFRLGKTPTKEQTIRVFENLLEYLFIQDGSHQIVKDSLSKSIKDNQKERNSTLIVRKARRNRYWDAQARLIKKFLAVLAFRADLELHNQINENLPKDLIELMLGY